MQQQGGSPYGVPPPPDMSTLFSSPPPLSAAAAAQQQQQQQQMVTSAAATESASPVSTRPPPQPQPQQQQYSAAAVPNYEELGAADDSLCPEEGAGGSGGVSGSGGNRWPRQETLALLKIRSDMDAVFRDATLKGPLWEEVSRKLGELGYRRSAKKCKEKFENVHKYYKRTKEGRAGRQDGKSYRFFSQLEALHSTTAAAANSVFMDAATNTSSAAPTQPIATAAPAAAVARFPNPQQVSAPTPIATAPPPHLTPMPMPMLVHENPGIGAAATAAGLSFSSNTSSDASETDGDEEEEDDEATEEGPSSGKKRKREASGGGGRKMMAFFEGMMRQVMERQEAMQQRFLEVIEKREQERAIREEAWRRQEMARIDREHEVAAGERAAAAARDAAVISFLQKVTGQTLPVPQQTTTTASAALQTPPIPILAPEPAPSPATLSVVQTPPLPPTRPQPQQQPQLTPPPSQRQQQPPPPSPQQQNTEMLHQQYHQTQQQTPSLPPPPMCPTSSELVPISSEPPQDGGVNVSVSLDPSSSRWPKTEVHALINLRSGLDSRYQESGPKGPLWEEISAGMKRLGYNRSAKRCKEKWENINKYFKKVKEGNKKRPEDAKTCPYFHQLDALYRSKHLSGVPGSSQGLAQEQDSTHRNPTNPQPISVMPPASQQQQQLNQGQTETKKGNGGITDAGAAGGPSNCRTPATLYSGNRDNNSDSGIMKKPEDIVKELMSQPNDDDYSDNMDEDDEEDDEEEEDEDGGKSQYTIQFQRPNVGGGNGTGSSSAATAPSGGGKAPGSSFLAMVR